MPGGNYFRLYVFYYHGDFPFPVCIDDFGADYGYSAVPIFGAFIGLVIGCIFNFGCQPCPGALVCGYVLDHSTGGREPDISPGGGQLGRAASLWVLVAVTAGRQHLGVLGMLINVPLCSVIYCLLRQSVNRRLKQKKQDHAVEEEQTLSSQNEDKTWKGRSNP